MLGTNGDTLGIRQLQQRIKELEEENKILKEVQCTFCGTGCLKMREELQQRINKAIEYIENDTFKCKNQYQQEEYDYNLLKILKGEEDVKD